MAKEVVQQRGLAIRLACAVFSISESCYRYESRQNAQNEIIAVHGLPAPKSVTQTLTTLPVIALLTSTDALAFLPQQWISSEIFRNSLQEIPVQEALAGPDIVLVRRNAMPLDAPCREAGDPV